MINYFLIYDSLKTTITIIASLVLVKYYIYLVIAPFYSVEKELFKLRIKNKIRDKIIPPTYNPLVTIIIPAWNEEVGIIGTIKSALKNTYNNLEIIVIDDGSKDNTAKVVEDFVAKYESGKHPKGKKIKFYSKENGGKGTALNFGIKKAKGEIVVTMDADSAHHPKAMENMVKYFQDPEVDALVGNVIVHNSNSIIGLLQKLEYIFGFYFKRVHSLFNAEYIYGGACAAFRKKTTFDSIGLFDDVNKTEDIEYSMRTKLYGLKAVYGEDVITYTEGASTFNGLLKQRLRWKKGRIDTFAKYKNLFFSKNNKHSKFMSWIVLPYAAFSEAQLLFEPIFFALIWTYTILSGDYLSLGISSVFILFTFISSLLFGDKNSNKFYILLFPALWLLFYVLVFIEFMALIKSIELVIEKKDVVWQSWNRQGIKVKNVTT